MDESQECLAVLIPLDLGLVKPSDLTRDSYTNFKWEKLDYLFNTCMDLFIVLIQITH